MTFTYLIANDIGKVRLELGDTDSATALFTDEEIQVKLDAEGNVLDATAALCDALAIRYSRRPDFVVDGQVIKASQIARAYAARALALRDRSPNSVLVFFPERVDGYSEDIANDSNERSQPRTSVYDGNDFDSGRMWT